MKLQEQVETGRVMPGWMPESWVSRLRNLADACNELRPDLSAAYREWADRVAANAMKQAAVAVLVGFFVVIVTARAGAESVLLVRARTGTSINTASVRARLLDVDRLLRAFERMESSGRLHVRGDGNRSWGLFQFGRARWTECGGSSRDWGRAGRAEQTRIMRNAIRRYIASAPRGSSVDQQIIHAGRCHNGFGISKKTVAMSKAYAADLLRRYRKGN